MKLPLVEREVSRLALQLAPDSAQVQAFRSLAHSHSKRYEEATKAFERSVGKGMAQLDWIVNDTDLDPIRDHPRYKDLIPEG